MTTCNWEALAEIEFDSPDFPHNYGIYCLFSRIFLSTKIKYSCEEEEEEKEKEKEGSRVEPDTENKLVQAIQTDQIIKADVCMNNSEELFNLNFKDYHSSSSFSEICESVSTNSDAADSDVEENLLTEKCLSLGIYSSLKEYNDSGFYGNKAKSESERKGFNCFSKNFKIMENTEFSEHLINNNFRQGGKNDLLNDKFFLSASNVNDCQLLPAGYGCNPEQIKTETESCSREVWMEHNQEQNELTRNSYHEDGDNSQDNGFKNLSIHECKSTKFNSNSSEFKKIDRCQSLNTRLYLNSMSYCLQRLNKCNSQNKNNETECLSFFEKPTNSEAIEKCDNLSEAEHSSRECLSEAKDGSHDALEEIQAKSVENEKRTFKKEGSSRERKAAAARGKLDNAEKAMSLMGFSFKRSSKELRSGRVTYRKKNIRGENKRLKLTDKKPKTHIFFDYDGNIIEPENIFESTNRGRSAFEEQPREEDKILVDPSVPECDPYYSSFEEDEKQIIKKRKGRSKKCKRSPPAEITENKTLLKYWFRRYELFALFDRGIELDAESWFSVTPEELAKHHAERCRCDLLVDAFCGAGGNAIQFAFTCERVIAIDVDPIKIKLARHNARVYGVEDRIEFILGDFTKMAYDLRGDVVFLSPPWGGPKYNNQDVYDLVTILPPFGGQGLFNLASLIADDIAFFLPKNVDSTDLAILCGPEGQVEIEQNFINQRLRSVTAYFGGLIMYSEDL